VIGSLTVDGAGSLLPELFGSMMLRSSRPIAAVVIRLDDGTAEDERGCAGTGDIYTDSGRLPSPTWFRTWD
jgi:hypothetical protein